MNVNEAHDWLRRGGDPAAERGLGGLGPFCLPFRVTVHDTEHRG